MTIGSVAMATNHCLFVARFPSSVLQHSKAVVARRKDVTGVIRHSVRSLWTRFTPIHQLDLADRIAAKCDAGCVLQYVIRVQNNGSGLDSPSTSLSRVRKTLPRFRLNVP